MVEIAKAEYSKEVKETVTLTVSFEYELVDGQFQSPEDEAHYNKYIGYVSNEQPESE